MRASTNMTRRSIIASLVVITAVGLTLYMRVTNHTELVTVRKPAVPTADASTPASSTQAPTPDASPFDR